MASEETIVVVGNPNSGKTTLFNGLTGSNQRIGNWPGVTVEKKEGTLILDGQELTLVDLPGIYSLSAHSEDERVARDYILSAEPGLVVNILDATNLERNLYLTLQLLEMGAPALAVVNMMDLAAAKDIRVDPGQLGEKLGIPVLGISATKNREVQLVKEAIARVWQDKPDFRFRIDYPAEIEALVNRWTPVLGKVARDLGANERWIALKILEQDPWVTEKVIQSGVLSESDIKTAISRLERDLNDTSDVLIADARYSFIQALTGLAIRRGACRKSASDRIDGIVLHRFLGIPIFLGIMYLIFWTTMNIGGAFIDFFDILFGTVFVDGFGHLRPGFGTRMAHLDLGGRRRRRYSDLGYFHPNYFYDVFNVILT